ncbi:MAG: hypothetical protein KDB53_11125 [Planctomycetes bacterium]|nr:hypothetical protein [Planctomycetota bacterium]
MSSWPSRLLAEVDANEVKPLAHYALAYPEVAAEFAAWRDCATTHRERRPVTLSEIE